MGCVTVISLPKLAGLVNLLPVRGHLTIIVVESSVVGQLSSSKDDHQDDPPTVTVALLGSWPRSGSDRIAHTRGSGHQEDPGSDASGGPQVVWMCEAGPALRGSCPRGQVRWLHLQSGTVLLSDEKKVCSRSNKYQVHPSEPGQGCLQHLAQQGSNQNSSRDTRTRSIISANKGSLAKE